MLWQHSGGNLKFIITEIDPDYRAWVGDVIMDFVSEDAARAYCKKETWSGAYYFVYGKLGKD